MTQAIRLIRMIRRARTALLAALLALGAPAIALGQEFQKVEGRIADEIPAVPFIGYAYGFIWIAVLGYVVYVAKGLGRVNREIEELRRKLDGAARR
jgi:CcmD family protein